MNLTVVVRVLNVVGDSVSFHVGLYEGSRCVSMPNALSGTKESWTRQAVNVVLGLAMAAGAWGQTLAIGEMPSRETLRHASDSYEEWGGFLNTVRTVIAERGVLRTS